MAIDEGLPPECGADDVEVAVVWQERDGGLSGWVSIRNTGARACRVTGKPAVVPLTTDGSPLDVQTVVTLELRRPDHAVLEPGAEARAPIGWGAWRGAPAGDRATVSWGEPRRRTTAQVTGPRQPASTDGPVNLTSSWFTPR